MKIAILIYNGITLLDAIGPYEVLSNLPDVDIVFVAKKKGLIKTDTGFVTLKADYRFKEVQEADILLIPGSSIAFVNVLKDHDTLEWIKLIDATTKYTTAVSSGSILLAKAGLLKGLHATSHWKTIPLLKDYEAIVKKDRVVRDGKYMTTAGVSAGIDMAFMLCDELVGEDKTRAIQLVIEYDPQPLYDSGNITTCDEEIIEAAENILKRNVKREMGLIKLFSNRKILNKMK